MTNTVSPQITDAVTQVNVKVVAKPPPSPSARSTRRRLTPPA